MDLEDLATDPVSKIILVIRTNHPKCQMLYLRRRPCLIIFDFDKPAGNIYFNITLLIVNNIQFSIFQ